MNTDLVAVIAGYYCVVFVSIISTLLFRFCDTTRYNKADTCKNCAKCGKSVKFGKMKLVPYMSIFELGAF